MAAHPNQTHDGGRQSAIIRLASVPGGEAKNYYCQVTLITPDTIRLEATALGPDDAEGIFASNEIVDLYLPLPDPCPAVQTRARIEGVLVSYGKNRPPVTLDLGFVALTPQEEERLRDSNPGIFRLPLTG